MTTKFSLDEKNIKSEISDLILLQREYNLKLKEIKLLINDKTKLLRKICNHNYEWQCIISGPYGKHGYICTKCDAENDNDDHFY